MEEEEKLNEIQKWMGKGSTRILLCVGKQ